MASKNSEYMDKNFKTKNTIFHKTSSLSEFCSNTSSKILREMEEFEARGSNWALRRIKSLELRINKYIPLRGSSYVELPALIKNKRAVINVKKMRIKSVPLGCTLCSIPSYTSC